MTTIEQTFILGGENYDVHPTRRDVVPTIEPADSPAPEATDEQKASSMPDPSGFKLLCMVPDVAQKFEGTELLRPALSTNSTVVHFAQGALTAIRERLFDLIKRTLELGVAGIKEKEDVRVFAALNALASDANNPHTDITVAAPMTADSIADAIGVIEEHSLRAARIFMNSRDYADIRKFDRDIIDPETQQTLFRSGVVGRIYGCQVIRTRVVAPGTIYVCGEREFTGRMPVRSELTILNADKPEQRQVGFSMFEQIGILFYNFLATQRIQVLGRE
jgi:hypothetical protein